MARSIRLRWSFFGTIMGAFIIMSISYSDASVPGPEVRVEMIKGAPTFTVNGEPMTIPCFETYTPTEYYFRQFAESGVRLFSFNTNAAADDYGHSPPTWLEADCFDYSGFEERARAVLASKEDAWIIPRINMGTPLWWLEQNPEELEVLDNGATLYTEPNKNPTLPKNRPFPSIASEKWRKDMSDALRKFIRYVQASPFGPHIFGYILAGLDTEEWYYWSTGSDQLSGYSRPTERAFRQWLTKKYKDDTTLRKAWHRSDVSLDTVTVPERNLRMDMSQGTFRNPGEKMNVIDFYLFYNELVPDTIQVFSDVIREETRGTKVIGAFYGYMYESGGNPEFGHNALERYNAIDSLDFIFVTASYENRFFATGGEYARSPAFSVRLHNKLWYHDNDVCSFLAPQVLKRVNLSDDKEWSNSISYHLRSLGYTETPEETKWMYRRSLGFTLANGAFESYFDLHGGYYDHPELMEEVKLLNRVADDSKNHDRSSCSQILGIADEKSCAYATFESPLLLQTLRLSQHRLIKIGAPVDHILLSDLPLVDTDAYKFVILLNCYEINAQMRKVIRDKLLKNGKHILWCYAPGLFEDSQASEEAMTELTGIKLRISDDPGRIAPRITLRGVLQQSSDNTKTLNKDLGASCGLIEVTDNAAETLGILEDSEHVVFARKDMGDWTSLYSITSCLDAAVYRELAQAAGVHIYNANDDTFYANRSYIVLHANGAGERTVHLPRKCRVIDVVTEQVLCDSAESFTKTFKNGETLIARCE